MRPVPTFRPLQLHELPTSFIYETIVPTFTRPADVAAEIKARFTYLIDVAPFAKSRQEYLWSRFFCTFHPDHGIEDGQVYSTHDEAVRHLDEASDDALGTQHLAKLCVKRFKDAASPLGFSFVVGGWADKYFDDPDSDA